MPPNESYPSQYHVSRMSPIEIQYQRTRTNQSDRPVPIDPSEAFRKIVSKYMNEPTYTIVTLRQSESDNPRVPSRQNESK